MSTDEKYPTPEDVKAYEERIKNHPVLKASEYIARYKANPTNETVSQVMSDIIMEVSVLQEQRKGNTSKTVLWGILNEQNDKWRSFCRHCGNNDISPNAFENVLRQKMTVGYFEWKQYRKLTTERK